MNLEVVRTIIDVIAVLASFIAFIFSWHARKSAIVEDLKGRVIALEEKGHHVLSSKDIGRLSEEIHELRGELKTTVRTVERMNQFLMERGA